MANLRLISVNRDSRNDPQLSCEKEDFETAASGSVTFPDTGQKPQAWIVGYIGTRAGLILRVSSEWTKKEHWQHIKCRTSAYRNGYDVQPGLYAVGDPDANSDVIVTANYKYSFDIVRRDLKRLNLWVLVLDTKGINVWCAAGKGTFGTEELIRRIKTVKLELIVNHKRVIVPQLGAPGVSSFTVTRQTGFRVVFGPVYSKYIGEFIRGGYKATPEMRLVKFPLRDRLVLTPMEINPAMKKYPLFALIVLLLFGLHPEGIIFADAVKGGLPFIILGLLSVLSGAFITPVMLPFIPFRSFAVKGWITGMIAVLLAAKSMELQDGTYPLLTVITYLFFPALSSYWALQFTGSTTFTSMSGVKREMKIAIPVYSAVLIVTILLTAVFKMQQWGVL